MHSQSMTSWTHDHAFLGQHHGEHERRTWSVVALAAVASAIILGMIALGIAYESVLRLLHPIVIHFREVVPIAALGLCVNLASAWLLRETHDHAHGPSAQGHHHDHDHEHDHDHGGADAAHQQDSN